MIEVEIATKLWALWIKRDDINSNIFNRFLDALFGAMDDTAIEKMILRLVGYVKLVCTSSKIIF